jgi:hypothetical protein
MLFKSTDENGKLKYVAKLIDLGNAMTGEEKVAGKSPFKKDLEDINMVMQFCTD